MQSLHADIFLKQICMITCRESILCENHPVLKALCANTACHLCTFSVQSIWKILYVLLDVMFHTYLNCKSPGRLSHNLLRIYEGMHTHPNLMDILLATYHFKIFSVISHAFPIYPYIRFCLYFLTCKNQYFPEVRLWQ